MFILHNVPKNKRQVRTSHPCKIWYEGSFLLFKYFLMTCQSATKIRFECLSTAEPRPQKKKKKLKAEKKEKQISRLTTRFPSLQRFAYEIGEVRRTCRGWLQQLQMKFGLSIRGAFLIFIFYAFSTCQIARQSIDAHQACLIFRKFPIHSVLCCLPFYLLFIFMPRHTPRKCKTKKKKNKQNKVLVSILRRLVFGNRLCK